MTTWTWMRHPVTGGVQRFADTAVPAWRAEGWEPCDPPEPTNLAIGPDHPLLAEQAQAPSAPEPPAQKSTRRSPAAEKEE